MLLALAAVLITAAVVAATAWIWNATAPGTDPGDYPFPITTGDPT